MVWPYIRGCYYRLPIQRLFSSLDTSRIQKLRNIGISAHIDSGKTTLTERFLFYTGRISLIHEVRGRDGVGAKMDSMELEREKGITIQSAATYLSWNNHWLNIIDTPGHVDFTIEVERALRVLDSAILVVCGSSGIQTQTYTVDRQMRRYKIPRIIFINKLDRLGASPWRVVDGIREKLGLVCASTQIPIGVEGSLSGIIDVVDNKAYTFNGKSGEQVVEIPIPSQYEKTVDEKRKELIGVLAEVDDNILQYFMDEKQPPTSELKRAIRESTLSRKFVPIFLGSAFKNIGVQLLLDGIVDYLPCPTEVENYAKDNTTGSLMKLETDSGKKLVAFCFKIDDGKYGQLAFLRIYQGTLVRGKMCRNSRTTQKLKIPRIVRVHSNEVEDIDSIGAGEICALFGVDCATGDTFIDTDLAGLSLEPIQIPDPVISMTLNPKKKNKDQGFSRALVRFQKEDPTFRVSINEENNEIVVSGMGELHLEIYAERIYREYGCECVLGKPKVAYRETISRLGSFSILHKKQHGGSGQFAGVEGVLEPIIIDGKIQLYNQFVNEITGGEIPSELIPSVQKGFMEAASEGSVFKNPVVGVRYVLKGGRTHVVDSNDLSFRTAGILGFRQGYERGEAVALEPIMRAVITLPAEFQSVIISGITKKRGTVHTINLVDKIVEISAMVPLANMFGYSTELRSCTEGKGEFSMEFYEYVPMTQNDQAKLIEETKKQAVGKGI